MKKPSSYRIVVRVLLAQALFCSSRLGMTRGHPALILILLTSKTLTGGSRQHQAIKTAFTCLNLYTTLTLVGVCKTFASGGKRVSWRCEVTSEKHSKVQQGFVSVIET